MTPAAEATERARHDGRRSSSRSSGSTIHDCAAAPIAKHRTREHCSMRRSVLKENAPVFEWLLRTLDPLLVAAVGLAAYAGYLGGFDPPERYVLAIIGMSFACATLFPFIGLYSPQRGV